MRQKDYLKVEKSERRKRQRQRELWQKEYSEKNNKYKKELKQKATPAEIAFKNILKTNGIKFIFQKGFYTQGFHCIVDFYIKSSNVKICIEIDGKYHDTPEQRIKDLYRTRWIKEVRKSDLIRFSNEEVLTDPLKCLRRLAILFVSLDFMKNSKNFATFSNILKTT